MLNFTKMEGTGNDYIYIDLIKQNIKCDFSKLAKKLSNRNYSIGSDGIILILPSKIADYKMKMYNKDGSEGMMCGNGIRCFSKYLYENGYITKNSVQIETASGIKTVFLNIDKNNLQNITVDMSVPCILPNLIPVNNDSNIVNLNIDNSNFKLFCVSVGNPHAVTFVNDVDNFDIDLFGSKIQSHKIFPDKTNVEFIQILDNANIKMRVYERGTGETMSCGTGACAAGYVCIKYMNLKNNLKVHLKGGILNILLAENGHIFLTGGANTTFKGSIDEEALNDIY